MRFTAPHVYHVWNPAVFTQGLEIAVHRRMSARAAAYSNSFSKVFESYVLELLETSGTSFVSEVHYKQLIGADSKAVEAIISQDGVNILVESKLTAYSELVNISGKKPLVWTGMKRIYEAMRQGWSVASKLQQDCADAPWTPSSENYLLIVTSQPMWCANGDHFRRWFGRDVFDEERLRKARQKIPSSEQLTLLPLEHIVIASIDEYEQIMEAVRNGELHLPTMFRNIAQQIAKPETSFMQLEQFLDRNCKPIAGSPVILTTLKSLERTITECCEGKL